jgi:hypothetical protein
MTAVRSYRFAAGTGRGAGWSAGRIVSALVGALLAVCSLGLLGAGGVAVWASATQRHGGGIDLGTWSYRSRGYAVTSTTADLYGATGGWSAVRSLLGTVRIQAGGVLILAAGVILIVVPARRAAPTLRR